MFLLMVCVKFVKLRVFSVWRDKINALYVKKKFILTLFLTLVIICVKQKINFVTLVIIKQDYVPNVISDTP